MATEQDLSIELSRNPTVLLVYLALWSCPKCGRHTALLNDGGNDPACVFCAIAKSGKDHIVVSGWQLTKSALNQINANRINASSSPDT